MITEKELILDNVVCYSARGTETKIEDARERIQNALFERNAFMTSPGILRRFVDKEMTVVQMMCAVDKRIIIDDEKFVFWGSSGVMVGENHPQSQYLC